MRGHADRIGLDGEQCAGERLRFTLLRRQLDRRAADEQGSKLRSTERDVGDVRGRQRDARDVVAPLFVTRYSEPVAALHAMSIEPTQKRPCASHLPSLKRLPGSCGSASCSVCSVPSAGSKNATRWLSATIKPDAADRSAS